MMYSKIKDTVYFALIWHWSEVKQKTSDRADVSCFSGEALANQSRLGIPHGWGWHRQPWTALLRDVSLDCVMRNQNKQLAFVALFLGVLHGSIFTSQFLHYHKQQQLWSFEITSLWSKLSFLGSRQKLHWIVRSLGWAVVFFSAQHSGFTIEEPYGFFSPSFPHLVFQLSA